MFRVAGAAVRVRARTALGILAVLLIAGTAGCSNPAPGGHRDFMPAETSGGLATISGVHVGVLTAIEVSFPSNSAAGTVHVRSVRLVDPSPGVHMQGADAFRVRGLPGLPPSGQEDFGTRSPGCPENYLGPRPVTAITLAPRKAGHWIAEILFTVTAPGTYHFGTAKIVYTVGGVRSWQYESLGLVIRYVDPPRPAVGPVPRRDGGCPQSS
jgi:hypothetical protein